VTHRLRLADLAAPDRIASITGVVNSGPIDAAEQALSDAAVPQHVPVGAEQAAGVGRGGQRAVGSRRLPGGRTTTSMAGWMAQSFRGARDCVVRRFRRYQIRIQILYARSYSFVEIWFMLMLIREENTVRSLKNIAKVVLHSSIST
jgi:hypothetical protein